MNVANTFNNCFSNIGNTLSTSIPETQTPFTTYLPESIPFSFYLRPTIIPEVKSVILNIKVSSSGHDEINIKMIKECCDLISPFLVYIINTSFKEGSFPSHLQIARIVPLFKKGDFISA